MERAVGIGDPATYIPHPEELVTQNQIAMAGVSTDRPEEVAAYLLGCVFDVRAWLDAEGVHLHNCFMSREGVDAVHSFNYKCGEDLTGQEAAQVRQQPRFHTMKMSAASLSGACIPTWLLHPSWYCRKSH